ncbi:hypothetical protein JOD03_001039 [Chryseomicrobium aureum]|uniref:hypothetical protein n=1 Tax=Chryseomicrobium aureum TaxID=1441723 RepID=UPI001958F63B|nr:hypothetical protein [Chryseomicrobium aureum]MBM7706137.1 hypothetical protein [Chryseomicrobium aureum]
MPRYKTTFHLCKLNLQRKNVYLEITKCEPEEAIEYLKNVEVKATSCGNEIEVLTEKELTKTELRELPLKCVMMIHDSGIGYFSERPMMRPSKVRSKQ